jgi:hypothetical protein
VAWELLMWNRVDFELVPDAKPYHIKQPFSIPVVYQGTTKKEID